MWMLVLAGVLSLLPLSHQAGGWNMFPWPGRKNMGSLSEFLKIHWMSDLPKTESKVATTSRKHNILEENVVSSICSIVYHSSTNLHICTIPCTLYMFFLSTFLSPYSADECTICLPCWTPQTFISVYTFPLKTSTCVFSHTSYIC